MSSGFKYLAKMTVLVAIVMGAIHVAWSAIVATAVGHYYQSRIFNIHSVGKENEEEWLAAYINSNVSDGQVLAVGSSFTFLYPFDEAYTYSAELNRRGIKSVNLSATGYGAQTMHDAVLCPLIQQNKRPRAIIIELSLVNEIARLRDSGSKAAVGDCPRTAGFGLFLFTLMTPLGIDWIPVAKDQFYKVAPPEKPSLGVVPDNYFPTSADFAKAKPLWASNIKRIYDRAKAISENVSLFVTPVYYDGVTTIGRDAEMVRTQFEATLDLCRQTAGRDCLDTSGLIVESSFANITHFNANGAKALADLIAPKIVR